MTTILLGEPVPSGGMRKLSGPEAARRAKAMACLRAANSTQCQGQVHVGLFFDGTGNNDTWVEDGQSQTQRARNKHSNVRRLFDAHRFEPANGFFRYYMPGVGTPFKEIGDTSHWQYEYAGAGLGYRGADRINYGILQIFNSVSRYLTRGPMLTDDGTGALASSISIDALGPLSPGQKTIRWSALTAMEETLAGVIRRNQRKVVQINVSIFGFSRGAAEARACAYWLSQICERRGEGLQLAGVPLRIGFMGLFDTVAAVGVGDMMPFTRGHMAWADGTQAIHPSVEDCAHFIALHEQRASFPLEAAVGRDNIGYPGMHSDVGGGYFPGEQGKSMPDWGDSPHLSQIPLIDMHFAAIRGGVPMHTIEEIRAKPLLAKAFATDARLVSAYNEWQKHQGVKSGDIRTFTEAHTRHYIRWRASLHLGKTPKGVAKLESFKRASHASDRADLQEADHSLKLQLLWLIERRHANETALGFVKERLKDALVMLVPRLGTFEVELGKWPLSDEEQKFLNIALHGPIPKGCHDLFADYVHDSRAGFRMLGFHEFIAMTGGYLRYRHVFKEEIHSESRVFGWANESLATGQEAANAVERWMVSLWHSCQDAYHRAKRKIAGLAASAIQSASNAYHAAEQKVLREYQQAERALYGELEKRYKDVKGAIDEYNSPQAKQQRQWKREAEEYDRMRPR